MAPYCHAFPPVSWQSLSAYLSRSGLYLDHHKLSSAVRMAIKHRYFQMPPAGTGCTTEKWFAARYFIVNNLMRSPDKDTAVLLWQCFTLVMPRQHRHMFSGRPHVVQLYVCCPWTSVSCDVISLVLCASISMNHATNIHHVSGRCW